MPLNAGVVLFLHDVDAAIATGGGVAKRKLLHNDRDRLCFEAGVRFLGVPHNLGVNGAAPAQPRESGVSDLASLSFLR